MWQYINVVLTLQHSWNSVKNSCFQLYILTTNWGLRFLQGCGMSPGGGVSCLLKGVCVMSPGGGVGCLLEGVCHVSWRGCVMPPGGCVSCLLEGV